MRPTSAASPESLTSAISAHTQAAAVMTSTPSLGNCDDDEWPMTRVGRTAPALSAQFMFYSMRIQNPKSGKRNGVLILFLRPAAAAGLRRVGLGKRRRHGHQLQSLNLNFEVASDSEV